jgi:hypothetical protein
MKRTAFARGERIEQREVTKAHKGLTRTTRIKSSGPKMTPIRKAARGRLHYPAAWRLQRRSEHHGALPQQQPFGREGHGPEGA